MAAAPQRAEMPAPGPSRATRTPTLRLVDGIRGIVSIALGVGLLVWQQWTLALLTLFLVIYLLADGALDILTHWARRRRRDFGRAHVGMGALSCLAAGLALVNPRLALLFLFYFVALRAAFHGVLELWELATSFRQGGFSLVLLVRGVALVAAAVVLVLAPLATFRLLVQIFAIYFIADGLGALAEAAARGGFFAPRARPSAVATRPTEDLTTPPRAVVFVRRSGAMGMGHVGWAFEWGTGWFNAGSVENRSGKAFTPPDTMDFWTAHTQRPVATMMGQPLPYDEFKIFRVPDPHPKDAWRAVVWLSRQPYSVLRRNCSDCAFDVLRAYGTPRLVDTAQQNLPNEWYDALPGPTHPIAEYPAIPANPARARRLALDQARIHASEFPLLIPARIAATPPPWRGRGGRAWYELRRRLEHIAAQAWDAARNLIAGLRAALHRDTSARSR